MDIGPNLEQALTKAFADAETVSLAQVVLRMASDLEMTYGMVAGLAAHAENATLRRLWTAQLLDLVEAAEDEQ